MSSIPAAKGFEAIVDDKSLIPRVLLPVLKSINSSEGNWDRTVKQKVETLNSENFTYSYVITEGDALGTTVEKISFKVKITVSPEGGLVCKNYFAKNDVDITEEKERAVKALFPTIEANLVANTHG